MSGWFIAAAAAAGADLAAKHYIDREFTEDEKRETAGGKVVITKYENKGGALGLLGDRPDLLKAVSAAGLGSAAAHLKDAQDGRRPWLVRLGLALITGGGISNVGERIARGKVTDYLVFPKTPKFMNKIVFNLGDLAIFSGIFITLLGELFSKKRTGRS